MTINETKSVIIEKQSDNLSNKNENSTIETSSSSSTTVTTTTIEKNSTDSGTIEPDFVNEKEKQCWEMYCKMNEKGVNITFDTILRGMLTPTEYRMRKKTEIQQEEIVENVNNTNDTLTSSLKK